MNKLRTFAFNSISTSSSTSFALAGAGRLQLSRANMAGYNATRIGLASTSALQQSHLYQCKRDMGWWSSMTETVTGKLQERQQRSMEDKMKEQEKVYFEKLLGVQEPLTLSHYKKIFIDVAKTAGYDSWKAKLPIPGQKEQMEEINMRIAILEALNDKELQQTVFDLDTLNRVREVTTLPPSKVKLVMKEFKNTKMLHDFLLQRRQKGLSIPQNKEEVRDLIMKDPPKEMISRKPNVSMKDIKSVYSGKGGRRVKF